jgi:hypothetical protein
VADTTEKQKETTTVDKELFQTDGTTMFIATCIGCQSIGV